MAEKPEFRYFLLLYSAVFYFYLKNILLLLNIVYALKYLHWEAMRPLIYQKRSLKSWKFQFNQSLNCVNSEKVFQISLQDILLCLKYFMQIMFCVVIAVPKEMSGKLSLKVSSKSGIAIMSKLEIKILKFVNSSCCYTIPELVLLDQLNPDTDIFWTNLFRPKKFRTNLLPDHFKLGKISKLLVLFWSRVQCFTV